MNLPVTWSPPGVLSCTHGIALGIAAAASAGPVPWGTFATVLDPHRCNTSIGLRSQLFFAIRKGWLAGKGWFIVGERSDFWVQKR